MNTDKIKSFFIYIFLKTWKLMHFRPVLLTETYKFECIAQQSNIKASYYVQRMAEHYFRLKYQSIQTQL